MRDEDLINKNLFNDINNEKLKQANELAKRQQLAEQQAMDHKEKIDRFTRLMSQLESSGGIDTTHQTMDSGIHKGSSAYGQYGLMPNTIRELSNRDRLSETTDPEIASLRKLSDEKIKEKLEQTPDLEDKLAKKMAELVLEKQGGDEEKAAQAWQFGHNKEYGDVSNSERVKKFKQLRSLMQPGLNTDTNKLK